jgi:quercetin dioxygenase-like cupin family protein
MGLAQKAGGPIERIRPGDVIWFAPGEVHWHGATMETAMTHIAIHEALGGSNVDWLDPVTEVEYRMQSQTDPRD